MVIEKLRLKNFRGFEQICVEFSSRITRTHSWSDVWLLARQ